MSEQLVSGYCDPCFQAVGDVFKQSLQSKFEVGASLAIEYRGEMLVNMWGGYQDAARSKVWLEDTIVNVWSVTKGVAAICAARLIEQGKLDLEQKVAHYWPEYGCHGKQNTTVMDVLCHRAGMFGFADVIPTDQWRNWHLFTEMLANQKPFVSPGSLQGYHAITFGWLVGELIRRVDGRSVGTYFKEEFAQPLNLDFSIGLSEEHFSRCADTLLLDSLPSIPQLQLLRYIPGFLLPSLLKDIKSAIAVGYNDVAFDVSVFEDTSFVNQAEWRAAEIPAANGHGVAASLAKLYGILSAGGSRDGLSVLKPETIELMRATYSSGPDMVLFGLPYHFGLGQMVNAPMTPITNKRKMFGHTGIGGAVAFADVDKQLGFSFFSNQQHAAQDMYKTANALSKALYQLI
jgi:CubicO group peptidase (beta-lactamase class C family)